jgi:cytochrome P450
MSTDTLLKQIQDFDNRPDPYPLYREIRKTPVSEQEDGSFVVSTYNEVRMLLHDPRISSDERLRTPMPGDPPPPPEGMSPPLIRLDPPEHDRLRRLMMRSFGPPHTPRLIDELAGDLQELTASLVDKLAGKDQVDLTEEVAHPLPVTAICRVLGVPREDEPKFSEWALGLIQAADPG